MSSTSNDNSHQKAKEVGWTFVREYYRYFNEKPDDLYRFYNKRSRLIRGLEGEEVRVCQGLQEIKKNISDMQLKDANVNITNIDSLDLFDNKVVVQVTGRFSNKGEAYRKFVQTIVLDTQSGGGYYVSDDIFRYLKEEADDVVKQQMDQELTYIDDGVSSIIEEKFNGDDSVSTLSTGTLAEESAQEIGRDSKVVEETDIPAKVGVSEVPTLPKSEAEDIPSSVTDELADNESKSIESGPSEKGAPVTVQTAKISTAATQLTSPTQSPSKTQTSSWATLAASDSSKWDTSQLAEPSKGRVIPASQLTRTQSQTSNTREAPRDRNSNREFSLYVKVGNERMTHEVLMNAFKPFGVVKNLDVVPAKSCAFVEFNTQESYQQALQQRQIAVPGFPNETVIVEERRKDDNRGYRGGGRQSYDNYQRNYNQSPHNTHNGMNSQRGRGGDRRSMPRLPAKSPS